jgi:hypothetical protein
MVKSFVHWTLGSLMSAGIFWFIDLMKKRPLNKGQGRKPYLKVSSSI